MILSARTKSQQFRLKGHNKTNQMSVVGMTETLVTSSTEAGILTFFADLGTSSTIETLRFS